MINPAAKSIQVLMLLLLGMVLTALFFIIVGFLSPKTQTKLAHQQTAAPLCDVGPHKGDFYKEGFGGNPTHGEKLFLENCTTCHKADMKGDLTGPALGHVYGRWGNDTSKLFAFIRNSPDYLAKNEDKYAQELFEAYQRTYMTPFPLLTNQDLIDIMLYIDYSYGKKSTEPEVISCP